MLTLTTLLPHQSAAVEKLRRIKTVALFMEQGTGKTRTAIELVAVRWGRIKRVVVFCGVSIKSMMEAEIRKHVEAPRIYVFNDTTTAANLPAADWYIIGTESTSSSNRVRLAALALVDASTMVIVDESSAIKNSTAYRTQWITRVGEKAGWRMILNATPITLGVVDLYAQMRFLSPLILGYRSFSAFAANHLEYHPTHKGRVVASHNVAYLAAKMAPYVYQVTRDECLTLPGKAGFMAWTPMPDEQRALYVDVREAFLKEFDEVGSEAQNDSTIIYRMFSALQQVTHGRWTQRRPWSWERNPRRTYPIEHRVDHWRLETLVELVAKIPPADKVVVWFGFHADLAPILNALAPFGSASVHHGLMTPASRTAAVHAFRSGPSRFFVATPQSAGKGLTLTEASHAIFYTDTWDAADRAHAEDRLCRIGQTREAQIFTIACSGTIDARMRDNVVRKGRVSDAFMARVGDIRDKRTLKQALRQLAGAIEAGEPE